MFDVIVIGSGFAGAVFAREMAEFNKKVLVLEKRLHIAGNAYEEVFDNNIRIHKYGPHIFHTNIKRVYEYFIKYTDVFPYEHRVIGRIDGNLVPIPFNFKSIDMLFDEKTAGIYKEKLINFFGENNKASIFDLKNHIDNDIKTLGEFVFEKVFLHYTAKQWGIPAEEIDRSAINRVPVVIGYDDRYFQDTWQVMPKHGYTAMFENILNHKNITLDLGCDAKERLAVNPDENKMFFDGDTYNGIVLFTGAIDEFFDYRYGVLPYRSLNMVFENYDMDYYQTNSVVNYPNEEEFTRITEFKYLTGQKEKGKTTVLKEYPLKYERNSKLDPYYPIANPENLDIYNKYKETADKISGFYLSGRLAEYKYYNMDAVIDSSLTIADSVKNNN